tara:strand:- start:17222 stop:19057 length:1836 start_codon:yes stop_codon:yes gene_type:complete
MDILKAGVIHEHVWKLYDELNGTIEKHQLHNAHRYYSDNAEEYELPTDEDNFFEREHFNLRINRDETLSEYWFTDGGFSTHAVHQNINRLTKRANKVIDKINSKNKDLRKELDVLIDPIPEKGKSRKISMEDILQRSTNIENLEAQIENMEIVVEVITHLKQAIQLPESRNATTEQSELVRSMLDKWAKFNYEGTKNIIKGLYDIGFFKPKRIDSIQQLLLFGKKEKIPSNILELFIPTRAKFDKEKNEWSDYIKYSKKESKDIFYEIINRLGISTVLPEQRRGATKKIKEYYGTDLLSNIKKIKETMKSKNDEDYQYLFTDDMIETNRNIIYKLSNHIMNTYEDARETRNKLDDSEIEEKTNEINELIDILEFLHQVMDITANLDSIDDRELTEVIELKGKLKGRTVTIKFDSTKTFPKLQEAYDNAEDVTLAQGKESKRKLSNLKRTKGYKTKQTKLSARKKRFDKSLREAKNHMDKTILSYEQDISNKERELSEGSDLSPQKKIGLRRAIKRRRDKIAEIKKIAEKEYYSKKGPYSVLHADKTKANVVRDLRKIIQITKETLRNEEEEKVQTKLEEKVKNIEQMIEMFRQEEKPNTDTDAQREVGDEE